MSKKMKIEELVESINRFRDSVETLDYCVNKLSNLDVIKEENTEEDIKISTSDLSERNMFFSRYQNCIHDMVDYCEDLLFENKIKQYADDNPFKAFNEGSALLFETPEQTLAGFMVKHITSINKMLTEIQLDTIDLIETDANETDFIPLSVWREKIGDNICYLLILWAMVNSRIK